MPLLGAGFCGQRVLDGLLQRHRSALGPGGCKCFTPQPFAGRRPEPLTVSPFRSRHRDSKPLTGGFGRPKTEHNRDDQSLVCIDLTSEPP